jgi:catechol 2,3-dioxygenase-like lactoylglutathione lyase family enzyme
MKSRLNHVALVAADPLRSAGIFELMLGAEVVPAGGQHRGPPETTARLPGVDLVFVTQAPSPRSEPPAAHVALNVTSSELEEAKACLAKLGLAFEPPRGGGQRDRGLYFLDYDNNLFELSVTDPADQSDR